MKKYEPKMVSVWGRPNAGYNPKLPVQTGNNFQPRGGVVFDVHGQLVTFEVDDTSVMGSGSRVVIEIETEAGHKYYGCIGSMISSQIVDLGEAEDNFATARDDIEWNVWELVGKALTAVRTVARYQARKEAVA